MLKRWAAWPRGNRTLAGIAAVVLGLAIAWVLFVPIADWLAHHDVGSVTGPLHETALDNARGRLLTLAAGVFAAGALVFTARNFTLSRRTLDVTEQGQVTDRYTKAIEQLGSDHLGVRVGAIYALERIMIDSPRDHPTIVEVLAAFVRESTQLPDPDDRDPDPEPPATDLQALMTAPGPATDVQAALTVLGRRPSGREERGRLNLRSTYLPGADLAAADLRGVDLTGADLHRADLQGADLTGAHLFFADLTRAFLNRANLTRANLSSANLTRANLSWANLTGATLVVTNLTRAILFHANLTRAALTQTALVDANLEAANLAEAILEGPDLTGAVLPTGYVGSTPTDPGPGVSPAPNAS